MARQQYLQKRKINVRYHRAAAVHLRDRACRIAETSANVTKRTRAAHAVVQRSNDAIGPSLVVGIAKIVVLSVSHSPLECLPIDAIMLLV
jgi:hypothetical protein